MRKACLYAGISLTSAATLIFELTLTRIFAVAEWYHLAFLSISIALLGYASSGTLLSLLPPERRGQLVPYIAPGLPASFLGAYLVINWLPFDSYQLAWDPRQLLYLCLYYAALVIPFACGGYLIAHHLALLPEAGHKLYAANLLGSAAGVLALAGLIPALGGEGTVLAATALGALGAASLSLTSRKPRYLSALGAAALIGCSLLLLWMRPPWMNLRLSPYKSLTYALQGVGARLDYQGWDITSRVDVVVSPQIHSAPGLSLQYRGQLPPQHGLTVNGGDLTPITRRQNEADDAFHAYLPSSMAYRLRPRASVLILNPRGGLDVATASHWGAREIEISEDIPPIPRLLREQYAEWTGGLYTNVTVHVEDARSLLRRMDARLDIVLFSLTDAYHPLGAGSFSLAENYVYTVESFGDALRCLKDDGLLVVTRWLQDPPSESVRTAATLLTALEQANVAAPHLHLAAFRSWSTMTLLASPSPLSARDIQIIRQTCEELGYDLVYYPGIRPEEANRYNLLPRPAYYEAMQALLFTANRRAFYRTQLYDVSPRTDNRPFFYHYFRWRQLPLLLRQLGKVWQPFGGSGFLVILVLLMLAILAATFLIALPLRHARRQGRGGISMSRGTLYFAALGAGYMLIEIPFLQRFILYLGQPALALIVVLGALLLFSGLGSALAARVPLRAALSLLVGITLAYALLLDPLFDLTLSLTWGLRAAITVACLLPLGILMGMPFAGGMRVVEQQQPGLIPWMWATNGSASVVSSILAATLALSWGYTVVLGLAILSYSIATACWPLAQTIPGSGKITRRKLIGESMAQRPRP